MEDLVCVCVRVLERTDDKEKEGKNKESMK